MKLVLAMLILALSPETKDITGTWNMSLIGGHVIPVGMELKQDGKKVTGTIMLPGSDFTMEGEFSDGALNLTGTPVAANPDSIASMLGKGPLTVKGKVDADGVFAGEMSREEHKMVRWTAERLRQRKPSYAGAWDMSIDSGDTHVKASVVLKLDAGKVSGTLDSDHLGHLPLEGKVADGVLTFAADHETAHIEFSGKLKEDGTLAGDVKSPMGPMKWTATRAKEK